MCGAVPRQSNNLPKAETMSVRIVDVREVTKPISSPIRNAYIDFTKMTTSLVAVITDVVRDGKPVVGYGFNSNGRYGQGGLIRERFAPRLMKADPKSLLELASKSDFNGTGKTQRAGTLNATIGVKVKQELPNGDLVAVMRTFDSPTSKHQVLKQAPCRVLVVAGKKKRVAA